MVPTLEKPNTAFFVLLLAPFIKPVGIDVFPLLDKLFLLWKLAAIAYLMICLVPKCFRTVPLRFPFGFYALIGFWIICLAGCLRSGAEISAVGVAAISSVLLFLLVAFQLRMKNGIIFLQGISILSTIYILAHIASVFLVQMRLISFGDPTIFLFGMDNYSAFFLYPMLALVLFYHSLHYGQLRLQSWLLLGATAFTYLYTKSMTAAGAGVLLVGLCILHLSFRKLPKIRNVWWIVGLFAVLLVLICGFQVQNMLASLLDSMSKGVTLNSRTYIWADALKLIRERPIFGYGSLTQEQINNYVLYGTNHAHNLLMELLLRTGVLGTALYLIFVCCFFRRKQPLLHHSNLLVCGLCSQLILTFMDFYTTITVFYIFMGVLYFSSQFCQQFQDQLSSSENLVKQDV